MLADGVHGEHGIDFVALHASGVVHKHLCLSPLMPYFHVDRSLLVISAVEECLPLFSLNLLLDLSLLFFVITYGHQIMALVLHDPFAELI